MSFPELLKDWIDNPRKLGWVILLCFFALLSLFLFIAALKNLFSVGGAEVTVSSEGPQVFFETARGVRTYYVMVHPQGWQKAMIKLHKDDQVECNAQGSVNIDLYGLIDAEMSRHKIEQENASKFKINADSSDIPENHYTAKEWSDLRLVRPWIGPGGLADFTPSFPGRKQMRLLPNSPMGILVAAIKTGGGTETEPTQSAAFPLGTHAEFSAQSDGELWMTVNDTVNDKNPQLKNLFYVDNLGFYSVVVVVTPKANKGWTSWLGK
jgi:hypothetical protein